MLKLIDIYLSRLLTFILVLQGATLVLLIGTEVFFRYILQSALSWPEEVAGIVFVWFTLLGVVLGLREDSHIAFDLVTKRSPPLIRKGIHIFALILAGIYGFFMVYYGYNYALMFSFETTPAAEINTMWINFALPVSGGLIILYSLFKIITLAGMKDGSKEEA
ncbi:MAG: TRAP transporter small permease [Desulfohalobiaceae bacterium]|nr:TRAP transporter small permease [Desulfohalobiaceae bacterium]